MTYLRERTLDQANHGEAVAEGLRPWAELRVDLDAGADLIRESQRVNQASFYERKDRA